MFDRKSPGMGIVDTQVLFLASSFTKQLMLGYSPLKVFPLLINEHKTVVL